MLGGVKMWFWLTGKLGHAWVGAWVVHRWCMALFCQGGWVLNDVFVLGYLNLDVIIGEVLHKMDFTILSGRV